MNNEPGIVIIDAGQAGARAVPAEVAAVVAKRARPPDPALADPAVKLRSLLSAEPVAT